MKGFESVTIGWKGENYVIPPEKQLMLVAKIEDALAGDTGEQALGMLLRPEGPPYARLAMAYGAALRFGGCSITDDEVYLSIMDGFAKSDEGTVGQAQSAVMALLFVVSPPMGRLLSSPIAKKKPVKKTKKKTG